MEQVKPTFGLALADWRAIHAALVLALLAVPLCHAELMRWPWFLLVPLLLYAALAASSILFGLIHANGYPPGGLGMVLAGVCGLMLGGLRRQTDGLTLPYLTHVGADITIFVLLAW
jgi:hypothetical protein